MKDNLFAMLINLFEKTLTHIKENTEQLDSFVEPGLEFLNQSESSLVINTAGENAIRIYTEAETLKFTKSSHQFLVQLSNFGVVSQEILELVIHQLSLSKEPIVTLNELKWAIRKAVSNILDFDQLAYIDLVLYQKEDGILPH